ncbi:MAG: tetratricopeptide repeat protein [Tepidisphaeraceae bacterium]|jgi:tetratricopeptide (TPR) repeat protein
MNKPGPKTMTLQQALDLGVQHHQAGRLREAEGVYRQILAGDPNNVHALHLLGLLSSQVGQGETAVDYIRRAIAQNPTAAKYHCDLGAAMAIAGRHEQAIEAYERAILLQPDLADAHEKMGSSLIRLGRFERAVESLQTALRLKPNDFHVLDSLGSALSQAGRQEEAIEVLRRAMALRANYAPTHHNMGNALVRLNRFDEAMVAYRTALELRPDYPEVLSSLSGILCERDATDEAIKLARRALALQPDSSVAWFNLGRGLQKQNRLTESADALRRSLAINPRFHQALNELGTVLGQMKAHEEAIDAFRRSLQILDSAEVRYNLGTALFESGRLKEAIGEYRKAESLGLGDPKLYNNLGAVYRQLGQNEKAMDFFRRALSAGGEFPLARFNLAMLQLLSGEFREGWAGYEMRWEARSIPRPARYAQLGVWAGDDLGGRRILLDCEQGYGDAIQFARYIPVIAGRGGKPILAAQPTLRRLLQTAPCLAGIVCPPEELPPFDVQCPLMSLPHVLGTTLETIPRNVPYIFADPALVERWRRRFGQDGRRKIGLCWWGNPTHGEDRRRSFSLEALAPLGQVPGTWFCSLQKGEAARQASAEPAGLHITDWTAELSDFADTAALIANLDLVISCDTAVAHLAGAIGKPVWLLLPLVADWRWMEKRDDSPWYPTMRLFRQVKPGDWRTPVLEAAKMLRKMAE